MSQSSLSSRRRKRIGDSSSSNSSNPSSSATVIITNVQERCELGRPFTAGILPVYRSPINNDDALYSQWVTFLKKQQQQQQQEQDLDLDQEQSLSKKTKTKKGKSKNSTSTFPPQQQWHMLQHLRDKLVVKCSGGYRYVDKAFADEEEEDDDDSNDKQQVNQMIDVWTKVHPHRSWMIRPSTTHWLSVQESKFPDPVTYYKQVDLLKVVFEFPPSVATEEEELNLGDDEEEEEEITLYEPNPDRVLLWKHLLREMMPVTPFSTAVHCDYCLRKTPVHLTCWMDFCAKTGQLYGLPFPQLGFSTSTTALLLCSSCAKAFLFTYPRQAQVEQAFQHMYANELSKVKSSTTIENNSSSLWKGKWLTIGSTKQQQQQQLQEEKVIVLYRRSSSS